MTLRPRVSTLGPKVGINYRSLTLGPKVGINFRSLTLGPKVGIISTLGHQVAILFRFGSLGRVADLQAERVALNAKAQSSAGLQALVSLEPQHPRNPRGLGFRV